MSGLFFGLSAIDGEGQQDLRLCVHKQLDGDVNFTIFGLYNGSRMQIDFYPVQQFEAEQLADYIRMQVRKPQSVEAEEQSCKS
jgi:hypothetical protein